MNVHEAITALLAGEKVCKESLGPKTYLMLSFGSLVMMHTSDTEPDFDAREVGNYIKIDESCLCATDYYIKPATFTL